ncbi:MAG TPA: SDR family NAD(P)-dependent oxidoreductase [Bacteroidetes bacterium]|nr:SDR family NAD(P)-dependent oxidoreductase [Bacteroidota bacterium]HEX05142.1 SDR family NAD(P)-dependent oxidoreductase [Bacteroidota bacterium]
MSGEFLSELCTNEQQSGEDAQALLKYNPDLVILNAGQIETEIDPKGIPLTEMTESITRINYLFPALLALEASKLSHDRILDIVAIGSIADGSPSAFGPVYHASKIALHYFFSGVGPIVYNANKNVRMRLYRPGAIKGPLSWAPVNRLNDKGYKIRAKRCESAPEANEVARTIARWIDGNEWIGTYKEPFSFKIFKWWFALAPNSFYRLQVFGWRKGSKFV